MEGLANNWSTTFLQENKDFISQHALFSLSCLVAGMTVTRLILGWALHHVQSRLILVGSIGLSISGSMIVLLAASHFATYAGMTILGAGLAACFPVVMGYVADKYQSLSGTALSMVLVLALLGNMLINYGMGILANACGTGIMPAVLAGGIFLQLFLILLVQKRNKSI